MKEIESYVEMAVRTQVFWMQDMEILKEVLLDFKNNPTTNYTVFTEKEDTKMLGFVIFGRSPMTKYSWDIYWLVVDKEVQGKGIGKKLLQRVESHVLEKDAKAVFRVETSSKIEYGVARNFYLKQKFAECGRIPGFYSDGDDLVILYKKIGGCPAA
jgi:ribosomal protein S18 acetylase RimI-like enzyme